MGRFAPRVLPLDSCHENAPALRGRDRRALRPRAGGAVVVLRHAQTVPGIGDPSARQSAELRQRVAAHRGRDTLVVVTHQVNITALTGLVPSMGEVVVLKPAGGRGATDFTVAGRITVP